MSRFFFIGLGGAAGAISRVLLMRVFPSFILSLPMKLLCVNVIGCLCIGLLTEIMAFFWDASINARHFLIQGFLGGLHHLFCFCIRVWPARRKRGTLHRHHLCRAERSFEPILLLFGTQDRKTLCITPTLALKSPSWALDE